MEPKVVHIFCIKAVTAFSLAIFPFALCLSTRHRLQFCVATPPLDLATPPLDSTKPREAERWDYPWVSSVWIPGCRAGGPDNIPVSSLLFPVFKEDQPTAWSASCPGPLETDGSWLAGDQGGPSLQTYMYI